MTKLKKLKPTTCQTVTNIVASLNISRSTSYDWCYRDDETRTYLVNIWHKDLLEHNSDVYFIDRSSEWADKNKDRALPVQLNRASAVSSLIQTAYYQKAALRVAILDGVHAMEGNREASSANKRELDAVLWYPHHKDGDRRIWVIRDKPQDPDFDPAAEDREYQESKGNPPPIPPKKIESTCTTIFERDSEVVKAVKRRAVDGLCELCRNSGFKTASGGFYLEAHHVIPLNCGGPDDERNVVAICANDHRRAHFSEDRHEIRDTLIWEVLAKIYPTDNEFFERLDMRSHDIRKSEFLPLKLEDNRIDT